MIPISSKDIIQKNLSQQKRQKCISILEKITKTCYNMFRNPLITKAMMLKKFSILKKKLDQL